jgi:hypothetical protein
LQWNPHAFEIKKHYAYEIHNVYVWQRGSDVNHQLIGPPLSFDWHMENGNDVYDQLSIMDI